MSIKYVLLGLLTEQPLTGYDLKKRVAASAVLHWSGNNNQVYKALLTLHNDAWISLDVQHQESKPPRKVYTITPTGRAALKVWLQTTPALPHIQHSLLVQMTWAEQLDPEALAAMLAHYEDELNDYLAMLREQARRERANLPQTLLRERVAEHWIAFYELELRWVHELRHELNSNMDDQPHNPLQDTRGLRDGDEGL